MQRWNLREIETPDGSRSPVVLHSEEGVARAVLIGLQPGQELGDHEVKERAFVAVVEGRVHVEAAGDVFDASEGMLFMFAPEERRSVGTETGARILLLLAPWPGEGHFRGGS
jgi:quercetin dioxygenase-like cupin family protein